MSIVRNAQSLWRSLGEDRPGLGWLITLFGTAAFSLSVGAAIYSLIVLRENIEFAGVFLAIAASGLSLFQLIAAVAQIRLMERQAAIMERQDQILRNKSSLRLYYRVGSSVMLANAWIDQHLWLYVVNDGSRSATTFRVTIRVNNALEPEIRRPVGWAETHRLSVGSALFEQSFATPAYAHDVTEIDPLTIRTASKIAGITYRIASDDETTAWSTLEDYDEMPLEYRTLVEERMR